MKTWDDIQQAALFDSVLHQAVTLANSGQMTREQALIAAALTLAQIRKDQQETLVEGLASEMPPVGPPSVFYKHIAQENVEAHKALDKRNVPALKNGITRGLADRISDLAPMKPNP